MDRIRPSGFPGDPQAACPQSSCTAPPADPHAAGNLRPAHALIRIASRQNPPCSIGAIRLPRARDGVAAPIDYGPLRQVSVEVIGGGPPDATWTSSGKRGRAKGGEFSSTSGTADMDSGVEMIKAMKKDRRKEQERVRQPPRGGGGRDHPSRPNPPPDSRAHPP